MTDRAPWEPPEPESARDNGSSPFTAPYPAGRGRGYAETALEQELARVQGATDGTRNHTLNRAAFSLGQLVAGGELDRIRVEQELATAGELVGLAAREVGRTVRSGLDAGADHPRSVPPRAEQPGPTVLDDRDGQDYWTTHTDTGDAIFRTPATPPSVWGDGQEVLWAEGEALMICGPAGVGKTTLAIQVVAARLGLVSAEVLGLPVQPGAERVLYLAMDRPPQIYRAMGRLFTVDQATVLREWLTFWKGPPPHDLARRPETLLKLAELAGADTVIVDSLKDGVLKLSEDESGGGYNKARQMALSAGVQVLEMHHQRKAGGDNKRPTRLDDVYGSTWLTAGAGSVVLLWGEPGDPVVEMIHLKQPAEPVGPWFIEHDHVAGRSTVSNKPDLVELARRHDHAGLSVKVAAQHMFAVDAPTDSQMKNARRKLRTLVDKGLLTEREVTRTGGGRPEARFYENAPTVMEV